MWAFHPQTATGLTLGPRRSKGLAILERWTMPFLALPFPAIDPVAIAIGPLAIRWYALAYVVGLIAGWWLARRLVSAARLWGTVKRPTASA